jgi:hypothetical protein
MQVALSFAWALEVKTAEDSIKCWIFPATSMILNSSVRRLFILSEISNYTQIRTEPKNKEIISARTF